VSDHDKPDKPKRDPDFEGTSVDLGEDLLTGLLQPPGMPPLEEDEQTGTLAIIGSDTDLEDQYQSAVILLNEGLVEDAKRVLHKILITDIRHVPARKKLEEIHDLELKQLFGESEPTLRIKRQRLPKATIVDSDEVLRELNQDLALGIHQEGERDASIALGMSLFGTREAMLRFGERIEKLYPNMNARDRIDMGIAFLEMGLHDLAVRLFRAVTRQQEQHLEATGLLAYALILAGQGFEATLCMEPLLANTEIKPADKIHLMYLMGRAHEQLGKNGVALNWYDQVRAVDRYYRDTEDRVRIIKR
jgi:tetratricopeptide (TPR) repeat protein